MRKPSCTCGECRKCRHAAYMRAWYQRKTPEQRRAWVARRDPAKVREQDRRKQAYRRKHGTPEQKLKIAARAKVADAIRRGDLVRQACEVPGCEGIGHAHHDDYTKPLDVRWFCRPHHDALHRNGGHMKIEKIERGLVKAALKRQQTLAQLVQRADLGIETRGASRAIGNLVNNGTLVKSPGNPPTYMKP